MILAVAATFGPRLNRTSASLNLNKLGCTTHSPIVLLLILPLTLSFFSLSLSLLPVASGSIVSFQIS